MTRISDARSAKSVNRIARVVAAVNFLVHQCKISFTISLSKLCN